MGRPLTEHELVERARGGDTAAYATLVRGHEEIAFRTAHLICGNAADAEDAAQDGFIKAYRALGRFRAGEPLRPWLLAIVANEARNRRRAAGRRGALALRAAGEEHPSGEAAPSPEAALLAGERRAALLAALARLRPDDQLVIGCRFLLDLSETETAAALGVRPGTVKSRLSRSLERLRAELGSAMADLARDLRELELAWPETPDLAGAVAARLAEPDAAPRQRRGLRRPGPWRPARQRAAARRAAWRPALVWTLAAVIAGFAVVMAASPDARSSVLEWLGLKGVRVERREPRAPQPRPGALGSGLGLGTPATLDAARRRGGLVPSAPALGSPDAVYLGRRSVSLVYGARPGYVRSPETGAALLVQAFPARVGQFIEKALGSGASLSRLRIDGDPAYFIRGSHGFAYDSDGAVDFETERLAGNTLLVERADGTLLRIEGRIDRDRAVALARSIRG